MSEGKHPGGRPLKLQDPKKTAADIEAYFDELIDPETGGYRRPPTMAGLAFAVGLDDRRTLTDYEKLPEFSDIVKRAKERIRICWESRLYEPGCTGAIFWLKNHADYRDSLEISAPDGGIKLTISHETEGL